MSWVKPPLNQNGLAFVDLETSGLDPLRDEIIQMAVIVTDFTGERVISEGMRRVKPTRPVPPEVAAINGYDEELWAREGVTLFDAMTSVMRVARQTIFVAHNAPFDWGFFSVALRTCNMRWAGDYHKVDTAALAWPLLAADLVPNVKLATVAEHFGLELPTHDALADVRACRGIYLALMDMLRPKAVAS